jgi:hypothetical protein
MSEPYLLCKLTGKGEAPAEPRVDVHSARQEPRPPEVLILIRPVLVAKAIWHD